MNKIPELLPESKRVDLMKNVIVIIKRLKEIQGELVSTNPIPVTWAQISGDRSAHSMNPLLLPGTKLQVTGMGHSRPRPEVHSCPRP